MNRASRKPASPAPTTAYLLRWKGHESGPLPLEEIRRQMNAGELSRMHQALVAGHWTLLGTLLDSAAIEENEARAQAEQSRMERERQAALRAEQDRQASAARNMPPDQAADRLVNPLGRRSIHNRRSADEDAPDDSTDPHERETSRLAVIAFVASLLNFVPYVNFGAWIAALVYGHTALIETRRDPTLDGRGLAVAALIITYTLLAVGIIVLALIVGGALANPFAFSNR